MMSFAEIASIVLLTLRVGVAATIANLIPGIGIGYLLARRKIPGRAFLETFLAMPLVLPPVAVGYLLLVLLSRRGVLGGFLEGIGIPIVFTWHAAAIAAAVMAFPLLVRSAQQAFTEVPVRLEQVARTLGAGRWRCFWRVSLPLARRGIAYGILLAFLRALGEFGATNLVAGNIPGKTQTVALGIYDAVQTSRDQDAMALALVSIVLSLLAVFLGERFLRRKEVDR
jgi:molybdate transport system permease protein